MGNGISCRKFTFTVAKEKYREAKRIVFNPAFGSLDESISKAISLMMEAKELFSQIGEQKWAKRCEYYIGYWQVLRKWKSLKRIGGEEELQKRKEAIIELESLIQEVDEEKMKKKLLIEVEQWKGVVKNHEGEFEQAEEHFRTALKLLEEEKSESTTSSKWCEASIIEAQAWKVVKEKFMSPEKEISYQALAEKFYKVSKLFEDAKDKASANYCKAWAYFFDFLSNPSFETLPKYEIAKKLINIDTTDFTIFRKRVKLYLWKNAEEFREILLRNMYPPALLWDLQIYAQRLEKWLYDMRLEIDKIDSRIGAGTGSKSLEKSIEIFKTLGVKTPEEIEWIKDLNHRLKHKLNQIGLGKLLQEVLEKEDIIKHLPAIINDYKNKIEKYILELKQEISNKS